MGEIPGYRAGHATRPDPLATEDWRASVRESELPAESLAVSGRASGGRSLAVLSDVMPILIGVGAALAVGAFGTISGLDRERSFYATILVVIASYYILFAAMAGSLSALGAELLIFAVFAAVAVWGFRRDLRLVIAGLVAHAVMDSLHGGIVANPGVPSWWPAWCAAYDVTAPAYLAVLVWRGRVARRAVDV